jgi:ABC-type multidrug transport system fused ATPase/permease subunit
MIALQLPSFEPSLAFSIELMDESRTASPKISKQSTRRLHPWLLAQFISSVPSCILIPITIITPAFIIAGIFISLIYFIIGKLYVNSSRDLKRIESVQRGPLYQHFGETLAGTVAIRAYGKERLFVRKNLD